MPLYVPSYESPTLVTALPASPYHGQRIRFQVQEGTNWTFAYNANSASASKWEFDGGSDLTSAAVSIAVTNATTSYVDTSVQVTLPAALGVGDWLVQGTAEIINNTAVHAIVARILAGAVATTELPYHDRGTTANTDARMTIPIGRQAVLSVAAGSTVKVQWKLTAATTGSTCEGGSVAALPIRVGG